MKFVAKKDLFSHALFKVQGVVGQKTTLAVLSNVLIEALEDGTIKLFATDLDVTIQSQFQGDVEQPGSILLGGKHLFDIIKNAPGREVRIEQLPNAWAKVVSGGINARIVGSHPEEYPQLPSVDDTELFTIDTKTWLEMVEKTIFSISTDEGRANLTGAFLHWTGEKLEMVSTDGHRLSKIEVNLSDLKLSDNIPEELSRGIIIPRKGLHEIKRTLSGTDDSLKFGILKNSIVFDFTDTRCIIRLVEGTFPDFTQVLPEESEKKIRVKKTTFLNVLKRISIFSNSKTNSLHLSVGDNRLEVFASDSEKGECREYIEIEYDGPSVKAGYNYKYLYDIINVISDEELFLEMTDTVSPTIIRDPTGQNTLFVVMPMRV